MFCYLLTFLNGHKTVVVCKNEFFSYSISDFNLEHSQLVSVQLLNSNEVVVKPE